MATITITTLEVTRIIDGYGFKGVETIRLSNGDERKNWYTVWSKGASVREGDTVDVEGELTVKLEQFTGRDGTPKTAAALNVNNPVVAPAGSAPAGTDVPF